MKLEIELSEQKQRDLLYYWSIISDNPTNENEKIETAVEGILAEIIQGAKKVIKDLKDTD